MIKLAAILIFSASPAWSQVNGSLRYNSNAVQVFNGGSWVTTDNGDTGNACSSPGEIRYNSGSTRAEFCGATNWRTMRSAGTMPGTASAGRTRYVSGNGTFQFHDGTTWVLANAPSCPNGGFASGGFCYYLASGVSISCDTACANLSSGSSCNLAGTQAASSAGATCSAILTGLGRSPGAPASGAYTYGCSITGANAVRYHTTASSVTCAASNGTYTRTCACDPVVGAVPPSYVAATIDANVGVTSCSPAKPTGLAVGDLMLAFIDRDNSSTLTPPAGWTASGLWGSGIGYPGATFYRLADAGDVAASNFTWSWTTAGQMGCTIVAYRNVNQTTPVDFTTNREGTSTTSTYNGGENIYDNAVAVTYGSANTIPSNPTGFTSRYTDGGWMVRVSDLAYPFSGTVTDTTSTFGSSTWQARMVLVNGASSSSPPACSGYSYGGRCYYLGVLGDSCDTTCTNAGRTCDLTAIKQMNNLSSNCTAILTGLGKSPGAPTGGNYTYACGITGANAVRFDNTGFGATCAGTNASYQRACGCR